MGRWDKYSGSDKELLREFRNLQLRLLHCRDSRKSALGVYEIEKIDSKIKECYQKLRTLFERNNDRIQKLLYQDKAEGFESFAWFLMLSAETQRRFR